MKKVISLKNIQQTFFERVILSDLSFKCTEGEKVCIVGENGAGKSTVLKLITGTLVPTSGHIDTTGYVRTQYVPQEFNSDDESLTVEEYVTKYAGFTLYKKTFTVAQVLGFDLEKYKSRTGGSLSGGQQKILMLAVGLAVQPDFLLLDEPENHLDIVSRLELMRLLDEYQGAVVFVSHDRMLVDAVAEKVAEVSGGKLYLSEGGYQEYIESRLSRIAGQQKSYDRESKRIKELEGIISILGQKAFRGKGTAQYHARKKELEDLKESHKAESRPDDVKTRIKLRTSREGFHDGKLLCKVDKIRFAYPHAHGDLFRNISLTIRTGNHIVVLGRNGSGKSTFIKSLVGALVPLDGSVVWSEGVTRAYFDQHASFEGSQTPLEVVIEHFACDDNKARSILGMMKFSSEKMETTIEHLSGGERMRIRFALVFGGTPDFIILDEPTNHLDEVTWEILLSACNQSKSTILLITHDYEFIEGFNNKVFWLLKNQSIAERHKELGELIEELRA
ncbi:MAG: ABC-F family ATP-binding cassette domain-containing protein [Candidatus Pacebacteria bacterium]|nr:ABC-F family ATP-binding cassette domain-containing protein [Candidatus Paceibacterota bacterium]